MTIPPQHNLVLNHRNSKFEVSSYIHFLFVLDRMAVSLTVELTPPSARSTLSKAAEKTVNVPEKHTLYKYFCASIAR
jgi:hypothetical protein